VASKALCAVFIPLECDAENQVVPAEAAKVLEAATVSDAAVIGPGIGETPAAQDFFRRLLEGLEIPAVVDASGLSILSHWTEGLGRLPKGSVLTPHPGEMARLVGGSTSDILGDRETAVAALAEQAGAVVVLKGAGTLVCDGAHLYENTSGNSGMASAGTGDVLAGVVASLIAEGLASFEAACLGVYLHGRAGDIAAQTKGRALTAENLAAHLPGALMLWERGRFERGRRGGDCP
jgi:NAD(P)H-hydrate epimerase